MGSAYEAVAGLEPLTRWVLPAGDRLSPAQCVPGLHKAVVVWTVKLPDRVVAFQADAAGIAALSHDGSLSTMSAEGKVLARQEVPRVQLEKSVRAAEAALTPEIAKAQARRDRLLHLTAQGPEQLAVAYWGGTVRIVDKAGQIRTEQQLPNYVSALAWLGGRLIVGLADGRVLALEP